MDLVLNPRFKDNKILSVRQNQALQVVEGGKPRNINYSDGVLGQAAINKNLSMLVCVTMYNEKLSLLKRTLDGLYKNIENQGLNANQVMVVVMQDGIQKLVKPKKQSRRDKLDTLSLFKRFQKANNYEKDYLWERINLMLDNAERNRLHNGSDSTGFDPNLAFVLSGYYNPKDQEDRNQVQANLRDQTVNRGAFRQLQSEVPNGLQTLFCFKHLNGQKLSSHMWFFQGFCRLLNPRYCVLVDAGTQPDSRGLFNFYTAMEADSQIGGCGGYMGIKPDDDDKASPKKSDKPIDYSVPIQDEPTCFLSLYRAVLRLGDCFTGFASKLIDCVSVDEAQINEYFLAHYIDKNCESSFGFLNVLPGAWSAYRYSALSHKESENHPTIIERIYLRQNLDKDFKPDSVQMANMYLAEDRLLCLFLFCIANRKYRLKYVPDAKAYTDPCAFIQLVKQRRRWSNSTLYAFQFVIANYQSNVTLSDHSNFRKFYSIPFLLSLGTLSSVNSYLTPAIFFYSFYFCGFGIVRDLVPEGDQRKLSSLVPTLFLALYVYNLLKLVFTSLSLKFQGRTTLPFKLKEVSVWFGLFYFLMEIFCYFFFIYRYIVNPLTGQPLRILMLVLTVAYVVLMATPYVMALCSDPAQAFKALCSIPKAIFYRGLYTHVFLIFSICNVDDVSWGTKGLSSDQKGDFVEFKIQNVIDFLVINLLVVVVLVLIESTLAANLLLYIAVYGIIFLAVKTLIALWSHLSYFCCKSASKSNSCQNR